jgi:fluoroquinolone transport system permease protein
VKKVLSLALGDLKNIRRDGLLLLSLLAPLLFAATMRFGLPLLRDFLFQRTGLDLAEHYSFAMSFLTLMTPMMLGLLAGFILLDERDENLLNYYAVTPLTKTGYFLYRMAAPVIMGFFLAFLLVGLVGLAPVHYGKLVPVVLMASLEGPMFALILGAYAANKVEGLALSKALGISFLAPLAGYLLESRWHLLAGLFPPYWVTQAFLASSQSQAWYAFYTGTGLLYHLLVVYALLRKFSRGQA